MPPQRTPIAILKARGSRWAGSRTDEPQAEPGIPEKPEWVTGAASEHWDALAPKLLDMGVLTLVDGHHLGRYCYFMAAFVKLINDPLFDEKLAIRLSEHLEKLGRGLGVSAGARAGLAKILERNPRENRGRVPFNRGGA